MRPRHAALALAAVGVVAGGVALALRPTPPAPERYRVELQTTPLDTALWFVDRFPAYFLSGEDGLGEYLDRLDPRDREYVLAQAQTLLWTWIEHELAALTVAEPPPDDPEALANACAAAVRRETLNQLEFNVGPEEDPELPALNTHVEHPMFTAGVFARLVRGGTNCEGQNHLVALLLGASVEPPLAWTPHLETRMVGVDRHVLVALDGPRASQPLYVDAWSNLASFCLDPSAPRMAPTFSERGGPQALIPGFVGRAPRPSAEYAAAQRRARPISPDRHAPTKAVDLDIRAPSLDDARLDRIDDPWRLYLYARVLDLYDDPRAGPLYRRIRARHCEAWPARRGFVCVASAIFLARQTALPPA